MYSPGIMWLDLDIKSWSTTSALLSAYTPWSQTHRQTHWTGEHTLTNKQTNRQMDRRTDGRYQVHYLPASRSIKIATKGFCTELSWARSHKPQKKTHPNVPCGTFWILVFDTLSHWGSALGYNDKTSIPQQAQIATALLIYFDNLDCPPWEDEVSVSIVKYILEMSPSKFVSLLAIHRPSYKTTVVQNIYITACYDFLITKWNTRSLVQSFWKLWIFDVECITLMQLHLEIFHTFTQDDSIV